MTTKIHIRVQGRKGGKEEGWEGGKEKRRERGERAGGREGRRKKGRKEKGRKEDCCGGLRSGGAISPIFGGKDNGEGFL